MAHAGGRPIEYSQDIVTKAREYIASCTDEENEFHKTRGDKSDSYERLVNVNIPTIGGLAVYLKIARSTIYEWAKDKTKPEFSDVIDELQAEQEHRLINNGLNGTYNSTIAKVLLTKHGYREGIENTGKDGEPLIPDKQSKDKADDALESFLNNGQNKTDSK